MVRLLDLIKSNLLTIRPPLLLWTYELILHTMSGASDLVYTRRMVEERALVRISLYCGIKFTPLLEW